MKFHIKGIVKNLVLQGTIVYFINAGKRESLEILKKIAREIIKKGSNLLITKVEPSVFKKTKKRMAIMGKRKMSLFKKRFLLGSSFKINFL